ncbi:MAG: metallophosphoesterase [Propionibacteriaceae bacterium]|jgi:predicted MPP superfamily phosphohydrolase|nr:metallophosphoesterase [Propionibacteriaceae bacterium]
MGWLGRAIIAAGASAAGVAGAAWHGGGDYRVAARRVPVLPVGASRVRVLHISDEHFVPGNRKLADFVARLADLGPDLVVSTGDSLASDAAFDAYLRAHRRLLSVPGVFVFGSNDYFGPVRKNPLRYVIGGHDGLSHGAPLAWERLKEAFEDAGWVDLTNTSWVTTVGDVSLTLRGTDDAHLGLDDYPRAVKSRSVEPSARTEGEAGSTSRIGPATGSHPRTARLGAKSSLNIGVTHAPYLRVLDAMIADHISLIFAGHTHGGQVCLPGGRAITTNCDLPVRLASGLHRYRDAWLQVSPGLGTNPYTPFRLNCPPTACLLDLVSVEAAVA